MSYRSYRVVQEKAHWRLCGKLPQIRLGRPTGDAGDTGAPASGRWRTTRTWGGAPPRRPSFQASKLLSFQLPLHPQARLRRAHEHDQQEMQEIQERPQAGDGGQRGRGAERHQGGQSANQLISQASKPLNFQTSSVRGGGEGVPRQAFAGGGERRGRGAERQQAFQSANQLISQASKPLNFQTSGVRGGGVGGGGGWG